MLIYNLMLLVLDNDGIYTNYRLNINSKVENLHFIFNLNMVLLRMRID